MHCPKCGAEIAPGAQYCKGCGAPIEMIQAMEKPNQGKQMVSEPIATLAIVFVVLLIVMFCLVTAFKVMSTSLR